MNKIAILILFVMAFPFTTGMAQGNTAILSADQVSSAGDIEIAIEAVTRNGTRPGKLILDSSMGDFYYTGDDKSINLYYSNVTLRSKNGATIANCDDGIYIENLPASRILIEGITFVCQGNGVTGLGDTYPHERVVIRKNIFHVQGHGVEMFFEKNWVIRNNLIDSQGYPVHLIEGGGHQVLQNVIYGNIGVYLHGDTRENLVAKNELRAVWQGVLLGSGSSYNKIRANLILGPQAAGIALEGENTGNMVVKNRVACAQGSECLVVDAYPEAYETNKIKGNTYISD